jgi:hypothetical protein
MFLMGGQTDIKDLYIAPTLIDNVSPDDAGDARRNFWTYFTDY